MHEFDKGLILLRATLVLHGGSSFLRFFNTSPSWGVPLLGGWAHGVSPSRGSNPNPKLFWGLNPTPSPTPAQIHFWGSNTTLTSTDRELLFVWLLLELEANDHFVNYIYAITLHPNTCHNPVMLCVMAKSYLYSQNPKRTTFWPYGQKVAFFAQSCCAESQSYCADTWSVCGKVQPWARDNKWWNKFKKYVDSSNSCIIDEVDENIGYQDKDFRINEK